MVRLHYRRTAVRLHVEATDRHVTGNDGVGNGAPVADHKDEPRAWKQSHEPLHRAQCERVFIAQPASCGRGVVTSEYGKYVGSERAVYRVVGDTCRLQVGGLGVRALHGGVHTEHARNDTRFRSALHIRVSIECHTHQRRAAPRNAADPDDRYVVGSELDQRPIRAAGRYCCWWWVGAGCHGAVVGDVKRLLEHVDEKCE